MQRNTICSQNLLSYLPCEMGWMTVLGGEGRDLSCSERDHFVFVFCISVDPAFREWKAW